MNSFEYLVALVSIIAGLALARALSGLAKGVHTAGGRGISGVRIAWTGSLLLWLVAFWWFTFLLASIDTWTTPLLLFVLVYGAVIYFLIALLYPDEPQGETDSIAHFLRDRRWFFLTFVALGLLDLVDTWLKYRLLESADLMPPMIPYSLLMVSWISLGTIGVVSANERFHRVFAYSWVVVMGVWVTSTLHPIG
jgi:hypothetical protein